MNEALRDHWNQAYLKRPVEELGWYEDIPEPSIELVNKSLITKDARVLISGAGASTLVDHLISVGWTNIHVVDISDIALDLLQKRLGAKADLVTFIQDDLLQPSVLIHEEPFELWIDRAVFHFFTQSDEQIAYHHLLNRMIKKDGALIMASFAPSTVPKCSGLDVKHHDQESLVEFLGDDFQLKESFENLYTQPSGNTRDFTYALFKKLI